MKRYTYFLSMLVLSKSCLFAMHPVEGFSGEPKLENNKNLNRSNSLTSSSSSSSLAEMDYFSHDLARSRTNSTSSQDSQDGSKKFDKLTNNSKNNPVRVQPQKQLGVFDFSFFNKKSEPVNPKDQFKNQVISANRDMTSEEKDIIKNAILIENHGDGTSSYSQNFGDYIKVDNKTGKIIESHYRETQPMQTSGIDATRPLVLSFNDNKLNAQEKEIISKGTLELNSTEGQKKFTLGDKEIVVDTTGKVLSSNVAGSKYREKLEVTSEQITREQFDTANNFMAQAQAKLAKNNKTLGFTIDSKFPDTIAQNKRVENFEQNSRATIKTMYNRLTKVITVRKYTPDSFAQDLINEHLDATFGKDTMSGQSLFSFDPINQKELIDAIKNDSEFTALFSKESNKLSSVQKMNVLARMTDMVMNKIGQPDIATFESKIDDNGNYTSTITSTDSLQPSLTTTVNVNGKVVSRIFSYQQNDGKPVTFTTMLNPKTGQNETIVHLADGTFKKLSSQEAEMTDAQFALFKLKQLFKCSVKATMWLGKQAALNVPGMFISPVLQGTGTAVLVGAIKPVSLLMGYKFSDPTVRTVLNTTLEVVAGDRRAILSADPNRVFTKGSTVSKLLSGDWKEQADPAEEYYTLINTAVDLVLAPVKAAMPVTFGDQLLSKSDLQSSQSASNLSKPQVNNQIEVLTPKNLQPTHEKNGRPIVYEQQSAWLANAWDKEQQQAEQSLMAQNDTKALSN
ncbi:MAG: hypothetical protein ACXWL5_03735 [Candidatus Chromulinivorax sp.]